MENQTIIERLRAEAPSVEVASCLAEMFTFEVLNAPRQKPHFTEKFNELIDTHSRSSDAQEAGAK